LTAASAETVDTQPVMVVIPTYNERENITGMVRELMALGDRYHVLVVDDSSPDGTADLVRNLMVEFPDRVNLLLRTTKEGIGRAYVAGFKQALTRGSLLIAQMDADHSHQPADLPRLVGARGACRPRTGQSLHARRANGRLALAPQADQPDWWHLCRRDPRCSHSGSYRRLQGLACEVLRSIELDSIHSDGYCFQIETTYRALRKKTSYAQVPITFTDRVAGKSKLSRRVVFEAMIIPWNLRLRQLMRRAW
jgi:dolichol-phosphate mannosyltransferase